MSFLLHAASGTAPLATLYTCPLVAGVPATVFDARQPVNGPGSVTTTAAATPTVAAIRPPAKAAARRCRDMWLANDWGMGPLRVRGDPSDPSVSPLAQHS